MNGKTGKKRKAELTSKSESTVKRIKKSEGFMKKKDKIIAGGSHVSLKPSSTEKLIDGHSCEKKTSKAISNHNCFSKAAPGGAVRSKQEGDKNKNDRNDQQTHVKYQKPLKQKRKLKRPTLLASSGVVSSKRQKQNVDPFPDLGPNTHKQASSDVVPTVKEASSDEVPTVKHELRVKKWEKKKHKQGQGMKISTENKASPVPVKIVLPSNPSEYSSNWKALQAILKKEEPKKSHSRKPWKRNFKQTPQKSIEKMSQDEKLKQESELQDSEKIWFDDVDDILLQPDDHGKQQGGATAVNPLVKPDSYPGMTKVVAMDCEMVGVGDKGQDSMLARVSIVNQYGQCVYDTHVKPMEPIVDYRTHVSGVRKEDLTNAKEFAEVQKDVADILEGRFLVGHALHNDMKVLYLNHPRWKTRDTSRYKPFRSLFDGRSPSLKKLSAKVLNVEVQTGEHNSIEDAQAAMRLYTMHRKQWERDLKSRRKPWPKKSTKESK